MFVVWQYTFGAISGVKALRAFVPTLKATQEASGADDDFRLGCAVDLDQLITDRLGLVEHRACPSPIGEVTCATQVIAVLADDQVALDFRHGRGSFAVSR